jgi:RNA polymerase sigma-70 factor, ECF subfamily
VTRSSTRSRSDKTPSTQVSLLARLRKGADAESWRLFVELYTPLVYRFGRRRGLQDADARDVAQKVMARVYRAIGKFTYDRRQGRFRNWLGKIAVHEVIRHRHRDARPGKGTGGGQDDWLVELQPGPMEGDWLEEFNAHVLATALKRIRKEFDELTWQAFDSTWRQNVEPQAAAARLTKTTAWIYKARFRVLKRLRAEVEFLAEDAAILHRPS